jgi:hypothetical protein
MSLINHDFITWNPNQTYLFWHKLWENIFCHLFKRWELLRGNTLSTTTSTLLVNMFTRHNDSSSEYRVCRWRNKYKRQYFAHYIHSDSKTCSSCCYCYSVDTAIGCTSRYLLRPFLLCLFASRPPWKCTALLNLHSHFRFNGHLVGLIVFI